MQVLAGLLLLLAAAPQERKDEVAAGPQPSQIPISWELEFKYLDPHRIEVQLPGADKPETFWYMVYTVTNPSPRAQRFFPLFQLVTDDLQVHHTDTGISPLVFDAIRERHKLTHKYLVHPTKAIGALLTGDDNARESVAVWRDIDPHVNGFTIYIAGLSGETRLVPNRRYDPKQPEKTLVKAADGHEREVEANPKYFTLRKTLKIRYNLPGSPEARPGVDPERGETVWVMR